MVRVTVVFTTEQLSSFGLTVLLTSIEGCIDEGIANIFITLTRKNPNKNKIRTKEKILPINKPFLSTSK